MKRIGLGRTRAAVAAIAAAGAVAGMTVAGPSAGAAPGAASGAVPRLTRHAPTLPHNGRPTARALNELPAGVPTKGRYSFLLRLDTASTLATYRQYAPRGRGLAVANARSQFQRVKAEQDGVVAALPGHSQVLFRTHSVMAGVAVLTDVHNYSALQRIPGVTAVYPISPKSVSNSYAVPLQGAPQAWAAHGDLGANSTIAIIDTGIDYTHADLGGPGTTAAYTTAKANDTASPTYPDPTKVVGGYDLAGDNYDAGGAVGSVTPTPDPNPLDCNGHGTHVAGIAAGYGENPDGTTFTGDYTALGALSGAAYRSTFRIGPGMAPKAKIISYKVFGCAEGATTSLVSEAIDRAVDPNQDGDPSDHASVINMSLGGDYASPQDGDSVEANFASQLGITVVAASGNGGDQYDVGGSPGNAQRVLAVANSQDAYSQIDSLHAAFNSTAQPAMGAQRSDAYPWASQPDISGTVVPLSDSTNLDGCAALSSSDVAAVSGKVAFLEWTDNDALRRCGSAARATNLKSAGAVGVLLADDEETFAAGIAGTASIPVVQVVKSAGDAIRTQLQTTPGSVTVSGTTAGDYAQLLDGSSGTPNINDTVNTSSSRGVRGAGNVKPDVTAVGTSVFSAAVGTGSQGISFTGTSMASPMVAGLAALVKSMRPDWTPEEVKADIMNTAGQDLYTGDNHTGSMYAPNRVGAGRIQADPALRNLVVAYADNADDQGAVSVSFGPVGVSAPTTLTRKVTVSNKGTQPATYSLAYQTITGVPGVNFVVSPATLTVPRGGTTSFTVTLSAPNPKLLTKTNDVTKATSLDLGGGNVLPLEYLADASGRVVLTPTTGATVPLRVPVYAAPRPASTMGSAGSLAFPGGGVQTANLKLTGGGVNQGAGATKVASLAAAFELQATSGPAPVCSASVTTLCVHYPDERGADLKYVASSSDAPLVGTPAQNAFAYFALSTQGPWRTPVGPQEFDIWIDTNGDGRPDALLYNARSGTSDVFVSELVDITSPDPSQWFIRDEEAINDRLGNTDTALFDSDTLVLPLAVGALGAFNDPVTGQFHPALPGFSAGHSRIQYGVQTLGEAGPVDAIGFDPNSGLLTSSRLSTDVLHPGLSAYSLSANTTHSIVLNYDQPGNLLTVRRDLAAYNADHGLGALLVHYQNQVGAKAQVVALRTTPRWSVSIAPTTVRLRGTVKVTVSISNTAGAVPTGRVVLHNTAWGRGTKTLTLSGGRATFAWSAAARGTFRVYVAYTGDGVYAAATSGWLTYRVV